MAETKLKAWAKAYKANPAKNLSTTPRQALALLIHAYLADGQWATSTEIADSFKKNLKTVRLILASVRDDWDYETSTSLGYRRKNNG
jgi:hypothetical protein